LFDRLHPAAGIYLIWHATNIHTPCPQEWSFGCLMGDFEMEFGFGGETVRWRGGEGCLSCL